MRNKIGAVSSYFFCYRAMSERVRFSLFYDMKRQCCYLFYPIVVAKKKENPFVGVVPACFLGIRICFAENG